MPRTPAVIRLTLPDRLGKLEFGKEVQLPFLRVLETEFPQDYGEFYVTPDDLSAIERNFANDVRRGELPLLDEEHGPGAAGWIKGFVRVSDDKLDALVELNARGEEALARDEYRRVSPTILRDYTDVETGEEFSMVGAGLALTTMPRLKSLDRIAASERPRVEVLAFAEDLPGPTGSHIDGASGVAYAYPEWKRLPLNSKAAVKGAMARFGKVKTSEGTAPTSAQRTAAWKKIVAAGKTFGVDVPASFAEITVVKEVELLMAEENEDATGTAADFADEDCPACGNNMEVQSINMRCPDCGATTSLYARVGALMYAERFAEISGKARDGLKDTQFAVPGKRKLPIHDAPHVRNALARFGTTKGLTPEEKASAKSAIKRAAKKFDIEVANDFSEGRYVYALHDEMANLATMHNGADMAEGGNVSDTDKTTPEGAPAATPPAAGDAAQNKADMAEGNALLLAERTRGDKLEKQVAELSERLAKSETATKLAEVDGRIERLVQSGRITPAEAETFREAETLVKLSESPMVLDVLEKREPVIKMGEIGNGTKTVSADDRTAIAAAAKTYAKENSVTFKEALMAVTSTGYRG